MPDTHAVRDVSFSITRGETLGLVGESGSGKSSIGATIVGLTRVTGGRIRFDREDITHVPPVRRRGLSASVQMIFQDPYSSLNPFRTIQQSLEEPLLVHQRLSRTDLRAKVVEMLSKVGLPAETADRYPRAFSGGQRQRIAIARALIISPELVICDEPVSALDLSVQAQVLNLLNDLQTQLSLSYLFISHDLAVVRHMSQRLIVMYRGRVMEAGDAETIYATPTHPYTQMLLALNPVPDVEEQARRRGRRSMPPSRGVRVFKEVGCPFASRCPYVVEVCTMQEPAPAPGPTRISGCLSSAKRVCAVALRCFGDEGVARRNLDRRRRGPGRDTVSLQVGPVRCESEGDHVRRAPLNAPRTRYSGPRAAARVRRR